MHYLRSPAAGERSRLPNSLGVASSVVDLRPNFFGLTLPPLGKALVPNAKIRKPTLRERFANIPYIDGCINVSVMSISTVRAIKHPESLVHLWYG